MESITRLVSESLARHGFDRPLDYRRLHWSRWFRCESTHSLLFVPSKPGVFALAEEIAHVGTDALVRPAERSSAAPLGGVGLQRCDLLQDMQAASAAEVTQRRMLAVTQFFEDDDMAFVLDRMLVRQRSRLASGRYFVRFVVIEDASQRRSICTALNQWIANSAEKASGIGSDFATSLELTPATEYVASDNQATLFDDGQVARTSVGRTLLSANAGTNAAHVAADALVRPPERSSAADDAMAGHAVSTRTPTAPQLDSGAAANTHCPSPFPSGF